MNLPWSYFLVSPFPKGSLHGRLLMHLLYKTTTRVHRRTSYQIEPLQLHIHYFTNVNRSCHSMTTRTSFRGTIYNSSRTKKCDFFGFIPNSCVILQGKFYSIHHDLSLAKDAGLYDLICFTSCLELCILFVKEIKMLISWSNSKFSLILT